MTTTINNNYNNNSLIYHFIDSRPLLNVFLKWSRHSRFEVWIWTFHRCDTTFFRKVSRCLRSTSTGDEFSSSAASILASRQFAHSHVLHPPVSADTTIPITTQLLRPIRPYHAYDTLYNSSSGESYAVLHAQQNHIYTRTQQEVTSSSVDAFLSNIAQGCTFLAIVNSRSRSLYVIDGPSVCRLFVVCNVRVPYSGYWNFRQYFYATWYLGHSGPLYKNFTEIIPGEPLRRGS